MPYSMDIEKLNLKLEALTMKDKGLKGLEKYEDLYIVRNKKLQTLNYNGKSVLDMIKKQQQGFNLNLSHRNNMTLFSLKEDSIVFSIQVIAPRSNLYELFNVQNTDKDKKATDYMIQVVSYLRKEDAKIWIGVEIGNPLFLQAAKAYINAGFIKPFISNESPSGIKSKKEHVGFIIDSNKKLNVNFPNRKVYLKQYVKTLWNILKEKNMCHINIGLKEKEIKTITKELLDKPHEYGGQIYFKNEKSIFNKLVTGHKIESMLAQTNYQEGSVNFSIDRIVFHTHPNICLVKNNCGLAWPSSPDMKNMLIKEHKHTHAQFIFTPEGTYIVQVNPKYKRFDKYYDEFMNSVAIIFYNLEKHRMKNMIMFDSIDFWLSMANGFSHSGIENIIKKSINRLGNLHLLDSYYPNVWNKKNHIIFKGEIENGLNTMKKYLNNMGLIESSLFLVSFFPKNDDVITSIMFNKHFFCKNEFPSKKNALNKEIILN